MLNTFYITGEGDVSFLRNVKALQTEYKKMRHNLQFVNELMISTFPKRREYITKNPYDLCTLFEKYPFWNNIKEVINSTYMRCNYSNYYIYR